jgi:hypothetical protein
MTLVTFFVGWMFPRKSAEVARFHTRLMHVAIRYKGEVYSLPAPNRHHDVIRLIAEKTGDKQIDTHEDDQGFLNADGRYLRRSQALYAARLFNQIKPGVEIRLNMLFSEDVW